MKSNYKRLGDFIKEVKIRNTELKAEKLLGINIDKFFMPSVANVVGTDMSVYKIVKKNQFACNRMHVGRDYRLPVSMSKTDEEFMVSPAYDVFEIKNTDILYPEYLMMWFTRREFDRNAWFYTDADVRGGLHWNALCDMQLPIPTIFKQKQIVKEYNVIQNRITLNQQMIQKLEETAQTIYKQWFIDFEFPDENGKPYKSNGGAMVESELGIIPQGWEVKYLSDFSKLKYGKMLDAELLLEKGYPVFSGYGIRGYYTEYMFEEPQILVLCRGDGGTGEVKLSPPFAYITNLSIIVESNQELVKKMYLFYFLKNGNLRSLDSGSAQSQITTGDLYALPVVIPPIFLQTKFNDLIEKFMIKKEFHKKETDILHDFNSLLLSKLATIEN